MMRGAPAGGAVGSLGLTAPTFPPEGALRLLGFVVRPEPDVLPWLSREVLPTVGVLGFMLGTFGTLVVSPGPGPPGTPTPLGLPGVPTPPVRPVPLGWPPGAAPVPEPEPPETCANASELVVTKASVSKIRFMDAPAAVS
jgi:hypothetical protein